MKRIFTKAQRRLIYFVSGGNCGICDQPLNGKFHADHQLAFSNGGKTITNNSQALCPPCNLSKGAK
jgi:5-methylcytosine-specific restriction endonuclease McrA